MSIAALIKRHGREITVHRDTNTETRTKGKRDPDIYNTFTMFASVQPFEPDETVEEDPGAERNKHGVRIYSEKELKSVDTENQFKADIVELDGEYFEVTKVSKWVKNMRNLQHYKSIAFKVNNPGIK